MDIQVSSLHEKKLPQASQLKMCKHSYNKLHIRLLLSYLVGLSFAQMLKINLYPQIHTKVMYIIQNILLGPRLQGPLSQKSDITENTTKCKTKKEIVKGVYTLSSSLFF